MQLKRKEKPWILRNPASDEADAASRRLAGETGLPELLAKVLFLRGYKSAEDVRVFLGKEDTDFYDPHALCDIGAAVERILSAIDQKEKIVVYGDYDVDGVTSVTLLYTYLTAKGADVDYYIPGRLNEGYGLSTAAIDRLAESGVRLMITVDNGITAVNEVEYAKTLGIDTVVTDHHECPENLPDAVAVVNPHRADDAYPFKDLAGVGVIFKVVCACEMELARRSGESEREVIARVCHDYADLVAVGTVADVMPLVDENRLLVAYGLQLLKKSERPGFRALFAEVTSPGKTLKINSSTISFGLAPRINAAGRVSSATTAVRLLLSANDAEAKELASELSRLNAQRQAEENRIADEAYRKLEDLPESEREFVIVLEDDAWHQGIIGIVASRITERYGLPSILITFDGASRGYPADDDCGKGSGRSIKGVNLVGALSACRDRLVQFGGHELAAGLSIRRADVPAFRRSINEYARQNLAPDALLGVTEYDAEATSADLTLALAESVSKLEPFGAGNPIPVFALRDALIERIYPIGDGKHTKFLIAKDGCEWTAVFFGMPTSKLAFEVGDQVDLLFQISINEYGGKSTLQLLLQGLRMAASVSDAQSKAACRYAEIMEGAAFSADENVMPTREDFALVFTTLRALYRAGRSVHTTGHLLARLPGIGYIKLKIILSVMGELRLCGVSEPAPDEYVFDFDHQPEKTDLFTSTILKRLKGQEVV